MPTSPNILPKNKNSDCVGNDILQFAVFKNILQDIDLGQICTITEEDTLRGESFRTEVLIERVSDTGMEVGDFDECVGRDGREN